MTFSVKTQPISQKAISGLAELIDCSGAADKLINQERCSRFHNRATLDTDNGEIGISLFNSDCFAFPFKLEMMERHPLGSQAFIPMQESDYLVILAEDKGGVPDTPLAFVASAGQAVNIKRNVWHGVLCPLGGSGLFAVVDRVSEGQNLQEHWFETAYTITN